LKTEWLGVRAIKIGVEWTLDRRVDQSVCTVKTSTGGACNNNHWQVFAYGISEYDQTFTSVDTFVPREQIQQALPGLGMVNETTIISQSISVDSERLYPHAQDAYDVRSYLKNWNPFI
jgi:hypothetical protein